MKAINLYSIIGLAAILSLWFVSCEKESDTEKPVINLIEPAEGDILQIGSDVHFEMELSDNVMLGSYKVEIHSNFDNHGHAATKADDADVAFFFERSWDVSGKKNADIHHHEIEIPENSIPGDYHLMVYCTDAAGNEANVVCNVVLSHEGGEDHDHEHEE
ncbi:MAG: DUF4625 domain-containing protein [Tannerella sp.]|jgi:hypothetical protein|nr:DUF4625 domain-containing protein [Tannerella sp.]